MVSERRAAGPSASRKRVVGMVLVVLALGAGCASPEDGARMKDRSSSSLTRNNDAFETQLKKGEAAAVKVWAGLALAGADWDGRWYEGLGEMISNAPEIVYGVAESVVPGRVFGLDEDPEDAIQAVVVNVRVREVLVGKEIADGDLVPLELGGAAFGVDVVLKYADLVGDEGLFFLRRNGAPQPEFEVKANPEELALGLYGPVTPQGVLLNDQGKVAAVLWFEDLFPNNLNGTSFAQLIENVRAALPQQ